jgi:signal transduction histidine kinase
LEEFVYIVSHDLRNSARALTEVPQWLRSDLEEQGVVLSEDLREDFGLLERHAERLDRMLLDLLTYSRVGRLQEITAVPLVHLIERVLEETAHSDRVNVHYPADLPTMTIGYKDGFILFKCMIDNVIRHCPPVGKDLWISALRTGDDVSITFRDNGPGVAPADLPRIFRAMTTLKRRDDVEGSGMGLAIVQRIARHYKGSVAAGRDRHSGGLCVRVTLSDAGLRPYERFEPFDFCANG